MLIAFSTPQSQCLNIAAVAQCAQRSKFMRARSLAHIIMFKLSIQFVSHSRALHVSCLARTTHQEQQIYLYAYGQSRAHTHTRTLNLNGKIWRYRERDLIIVVRSFFMRLI